MNPSIYFYVGDEFTDDNFDSVFTNVPFLPNEGETIILHGEEHMVVERRLNFVQPTEGFNKLVDVSIRVAKINLGD